MCLINKIIVSQLLPVEVADVRICCSGVAKKRRVSHGADVALGLVDILPLLLVGVAWLALLTVLNILVTPGPRFIVIRICLHLGLLLEGVDLLLQSLLVTESWVILLSFRTWLAINATLGLTLARESALARLDLVQTDHVLGSERVTAGH